MHLPTYIYLYIMYPLAGIQTLHLHSYLYCKGELCTDIIYPHVYIVSSDTTAAVILLLYCRSLMVGDVNHDGHDDLVVGAPDYGELGSPQLGAVYVVYGMFDSGAVCT